MYIDFNFLFFFTSIKAPYPYSTDERIYIVVEYFKNEESVIKTQRSLERKYHIRLDHKTINRVEETFLKYGELTKPRNENHI